MPNQSISLTQEQRLQMVLAPQLRQSLEMLQAPVMELRALVREELDKNPTLEEIPTDVISTSPSSKKDDLEDHTRMDFREEFNILARLDDEWKDYFFQEEKRHYTSEDADRRKFFFDSIEQTTSLQEHLLQQLALAELSDADRHVGELIVGSINEDGFLVGAIAELAANATIDEEHLLAVLAVIQEFDPPGVGARDLRECLLLQLERLGQADSLAAHIIQDHLERLGAKKFADIAKALKENPENIQAAAGFIATLDPRPGRVYGMDTSPYITPEVLVQKVDDQYVVILNDDDLPHLRISKQYRSLMNESGTTDEVKKYIVDKVRAGAFLMKSIRQRQQTIYKIATEIVRIQRDFLEHGIAHLKPLIMSDVAKAVGLHETTISRAVSGKHMQTPRGVFEMKFFFTPGLKMADGHVLSNKTVKDMISSIISAEDTTHPLSDQEIYEKLQKNGLTIARRTVAKYRIALRIQPSHLRKSF